MGTAEHAENAERGPSDFLYREEGYGILGSCFSVYKDKGCGFLEPVYQECLAIEFELRNIPFEREVALKLNYKGRDLGLAYRPDFVCFGKIIVELKAVTEITNEHRAQVLNYLKATGLKVAYLVNFGHHPKVEFERIVLS